MSSIIQTFFPENSTLLVTGTGSIVDNLTEHKADAIIIDIQGEFKKISDYCFSGYSVVNKIILPDSIEEIGNGILSGTTLENFTLPKNVKTLSSMQSFDQTYNLKNIFVAEENQNFCDIDGILFSKDKSILYFIPGGRPDKIQIIPNFVTKLEVAAVSYSANLETVIIPSSVKRIEWYFGHRSKSLSAIYIIQCQKTVSIDFRNAMSGTDYANNPQSIIHYLTPNNCITHNIVCIPSTQYFKMLYLCIIYGII